MEKRRVERFVTGLKKILFREVEGGSGSRVKGYRIAGPTQSNKKAEASL